MSYSFSPARNYLIISVILLSFIACQREIDSPAPGNTGNNNTVMVNAGVRGVVIDENSQPVPGATVTSGTNTTTTDRYGVFSFKNIPLSKDNGSVKVEKAGYFNAVKSFVTTAGRTHNVRLRLIPKMTTGTFNGATGGTVSLPSGAKLVFPASAVTDASGNPYTGTVNIAMTWIDPTSPNLPELVPGDLRGITTGGTEMGLETYGMIGVEMTGGGATLKIASGKTAELSFPVPASMAGTAPATIDLWHFDEATARWKQEGTATKTGNFYIANVSHFSFWNCDAPFPLINLCMTLIDAASNQPLNNISVRIQRPNGSYGYGRTDSAGNLCGKVPKNEALVLQVMDQCNNIAYSQNIGPFTGDANLGTISVNLPPTNSLIITGTVTNCAGANVTNGAAVIYTNGSYSHVVPVTNGSFSLTLVRCAATTLNFTVMGIDYTALQQSVPVSGTGSTGTVNVGTVQACGTSSLQYAEYIVDGTIYSFVNPPNLFIYVDSTAATPPFTNRTTFYAVNGNQGTTAGSAMLTFDNNGTVGTVPIISGRFQYTASLQALQFVNANPVVNLTLFGNSGGGFIEGNFNQPMLFGTTPKNVICNFRVRRN